MNKILRIGAAIGIALGIRACMLVVEDKINQYDKETLISKYRNMPVEQIQKSIKDLRGAQRLSEIIYNANGCCPKGAGLIAYLLKDDNYPVKFVRLQKEGWGFHWFFVYENKSKIYCADNGLFGVVKCSSINELVKYVEKREKTKGIAYTTSDKMPSEFNSEKVNEDINIAYEFMKNKGI